MTGKENIYVVTVTYGNRFHLLRQVIEASLNEGVKKVIVVDNNSAMESKSQLRAYEKFLNDKIKVLYLDDNYGSAGGYKRGLEEVYHDSECKFIWLLDDDNVPKKGVLSLLVNCWHEMAGKHQNARIALAPYRHKKEFIQAEAALQKKPDFVLGPKNSFLGFSILELPSKIRRYIYRKFKNDGYLEISMTYDRIIQHRNIAYHQIAAAPYGGLFISKKILNVIGYPDEELVTYMDDIEWSYRITKKGGHIYVCFNCLIDDIDIPWHFNGNQSSVFHILLNNGDDERVYYTVRNKIYFGKKCLNHNKFIRLMNEKVFMFTLKLFSAFSVSEGRMNIINRAISDAKKENLGKI